MSTPKPWEETWVVAEDNYNDIQKVNTDNGVITGLFATVDGTPEQSTLAAAAPDMARALMGVVEGTLKCHAPVFGPLTIDEVVERGHPISITAGELGAMVAALRKAGVP